MKISSLFIVLGIIIGLLSLSLGFCHMKKRVLLIDQIKAASDLIVLFPHTPGEIKQLAKEHMAHAEKGLQAIIAVPSEDRTFANTAQTLDTLCGLSDLAIIENSISLLKEVHPDAAMRQAAHEAASMVQAFWIDKVSNNKKLYNALKEYVEGNAKNETLTDAQKYYLQESMKSFQRAGLELPDDQLMQLSALKKELSDLSLVFARNSAADNSMITATREQLAGLDDDFINALKKTEDGNYIFGVDYPTYFNVMENCIIEDTRKRLNIAFSNRAYPENEKVLKQIIAKRDKLAKMLGFNSFADYDLDMQMVGSVVRAQDFLDNLLAKAHKKVEREIAMLITDLPESVSLTEDGKIKPWDSSFLKAHYKKKHYSVDERKIAEYFPMAKTIDGLFDIYKKFFSIDFKQVPAGEVWHEDVRLIEVYNADHSKLHGYIFLDLHPRPNKYSHAAHGSIVPATTHNGVDIPAVSLVMANFPKATADKPALFKRSDVSTFFHEFGHALHAMLGRTQLATQSGTNVKRDFVELPSQMLEEWLWDRDMLKMVSSHYQTGESLPDAMINNILKLKTFDTGDFVQRQSVLSYAALRYYQEGADKDLYGIMQELYRQLRPQYMWSPDNHFYAAWGHLTGYAAKYYGYMWSKVFALDIFDQIKQQGLLNPVIGQRYVQEVIGKGGSADPNDLLRNFLGREPNSKAFFEDLGFV